ncbi:mitochondrial assembly of ribosomal large subunit protein 1 [Pelobates fuscus]|uniref:mitochondrial assembly of ribosomal large subunit protein 1 n=1 Tax=Pelobates fuscus TaxID=191477 RepID=UPI002FE4E324
MWAQCLPRFYPVCVTGYRALCSAPQLCRNVSLGSVQSIVEAACARVTGQAAVRTLHLHPGLNGLTAGGVGRSSGSEDTQDIDGLPLPRSQAEPEPRQEMMDNALLTFNIDLLVKLLRQENGKDVCVIKIPPEVKYAEYFVIVSGFSTRHLQAMAQYTLKVFKSLKRVSNSQIILEGKDTDDWMCIDFGDIVVHFMLPETRELYELEKLWTLRSYDDQLSQIAHEILPADFTFGLQSKTE